MDSVWLVNVLGKVCVELTCVGLSESSVTLPVWDVRDSRVVFSEVEGLFVMVAVCCECSVV